jgi:hypothetical protein
MANMPSTFMAGTASGQAAHQAAGAVAPTADNVNDLFDGLKEMSWRGIPFPVVETELDLRQDLAIHKRVDRDGAHIEGTGRAPLQITARIPFINRLSHGKIETWDRPLYPVVWRQIFAACADKTSGLVVHPELEAITCKCEHMHTRWSADARGGVFVNITFLETDDGINDLSLDLGRSSPISQAQAAADDLDGNVLILNPSITPKPYSPPFSFSDLMRSIRAVVDLPSLTAKQYAGRVDNFIYEANALIDSMNSAPNANALNWPILQAAEIAKSACLDIKATQMTTGKPMGLYTLPVDATFAQISSSIGADLGELMLLNPAFIQRPVVPAGSVFRFYSV